MYKSKDLEILYSCFKIIIHLNLWNSPPLKLWHTISFRRNTSPFPVTIGPTSDSSNMNPKL